MNRPLIILILALTLGLVFNYMTPAALAQDTSTQSYVVQKGDTINSIAKQFYGKGSLGSKLWKANKNVVAHPKKLTPGDVIYIFPESTLSLNQAVTLPPSPEAPPTDLYKSEELLTMTFPKYFSFVADPRGLGGTGTYRIRVKKSVPVKVFKEEEDGKEATEEIKYKKLDETYEVRIVGDIISSSDRGTAIIDDGFSSSAAGRTLLSTGDNIVVRFTDDVAKILDSDTYDNADPYFNSFPIYALEKVIQAPDKQRADYGSNLGQIFAFKGRLNIVSRIETLVPAKSSTSAKIKSRKNKLNQDIEPVSYMARITYSEDAIHLGDKVLLFKPLDPGTERRLDSPYVEPPDSYVSPGK